MNPEVQSNDQKSSRIEIKKLSSKNSNESSKIEEEDF